MRGFELQHRIWTRCAAAVVACALLAPAALAQGAAPPPEPEPEQKPGVFQSIGRWFDQGATNFRDHLLGAKRKMDDLGDEAVATAEPSVTGRPRPARTPPMPPRARSTAWPSFQWRA